MTFAGNFNSWKSAENTSSGVSTSRWDSNSIGGIRKATSELGNTMPVNGGLSQPSIQKTVNGEWIYLRFKDVKYIKGIRLINSGPQLSSNTADMGYNFVNRVHIFGNFYRSNYGRI